MSHPVTVLQIEGLQLRRADRQILRGVDLQLHPGEVFALMGDSGAGKSTVLRATAALEPFDAGVIHVGEVRLAPGALPAESRLQALRQRLGFVFQQHALFAHLSARENVMLAMIHVARLTPRAARDRAEALLTSLGVAHRAEALPRELSGGEAQRVAIARALALEPQLLLMDEPTAALDPARREALAETLRALASEGRTLLLTTHDHDFARAVADRVAVLAQGTVVAIGAPHLILDGIPHVA